MFPSHQTEASKAIEASDKRAFIEYLKREKICERLAQEELLTPPASRPQKGSSSSSDSYWGKAQSVLELAVGHIQNFKQQSARIESSKLENEDQRFYPNVRNIRAVCESGKLMAGVATLSPVDCPGTLFVESVRQSSESIDRWLCVWSKVELSEFLRCKSHKEEFPA